MLKNLLFKDIRGFREKVVRKLGRRVLLDEEALLLFLFQTVNRGVNGGLPKKYNRSWQSGYADKK